MGKILALDLSSHTGFCVGTPGHAIAWGVRHLDMRTSLGRGFNGWLTELCQLIEDHEPDLILMEKALNLRAQTRHDAAYQQFGLSVISEAIADRYDVDIKQVSSGDVRKMIMGKSRGWAKDKTDFVAYVRRNGFDDVLDDNVADAILTWMYGCRIQQRKAA